MSQGALEAGGQSLEFALPFTERPSTPSLTYVDLKVVNGQNKPMVWQFCRALDCNLIPSESVLGYLNCHIQRMTAPRCRAVTLRLLFS